MTREIKFRAWSGEEMVSTEYIDRNGLGFWNENSIPTYSDKLMQYTGLKDSNGKDIYDPGVDVTKVRLQIGMVFQKPNPFPSMTIGENVLAGLKLAQLKVENKEENIKEI